MVLTKKQAATATKIKKWIDTVKDVERGQLWISVTRLTSIKSLCKDDEIAAEHFGLFIAQKVLDKMKAKGCPEHTPEEEWKLYKKVITDGINLMKDYRSNPTYEGKEAMRKMLREIDVLQGDDRRRVHWTTVHFVRSGDLLKLDYALRCFVDRDFPYWAYRLAREYVEKYSDITVESIPMLLEVAEFWCQYCFDKTLVEKFPKLMSDVGGEADLRSP
ncbi:MAG: hypothetical protein F6K35_42130 [Okeania sp. SIO2H7]|nr:hypothetical protein [Okeania sp. SIO2H7]